MYSSHALVLFVAAADVRQLLERFTVRLNLNCVARFDIFTCVAKLAAHCCHPEVQVLNIGSLELFMLLSLDFWTVRVKSWNLSRVFVLNVFDNAINKLEEAVARGIGSACVRRRCRNHGTVTVERYPNNGAKTV